VPGGEQTDRFKLQIIKLQSTAQQLQLGSATSWSHCFAFLIECGYIMDSGREIDEMLEVAKLR
jgi:hypothetical protein